MSAAKSLTDDQIAEIQSWADDGASLADIQKRLADEMEVRVTYMEMRFLIDDIGVKLKPDEPKPAPEPEPEREPEPETESAADDVSEFSDIDPDAAPVDEDAPTEAVKADVTVDEVQRPGMIVNGKVEFDGGKTLDWYLDQVGRLGVDPGIDESFRPSEAQLRVFQENLQVALREKGYG